jgi:hypothetical protein
VTLKADVERVLDVHQPHDAAWMRDRLFSMDLDQEQVTFLGEQVHAARTAKSRRPELADGSPD